MKTIVFAGSKGGCGRSTLSFCVAIEAAKTASVYLADVDPQASLIDLCSRRADRIESDNPMQLQNVESIADAKRRLSGSGFDRDYLIVDTPGSFMDIVTDAIAAADVIVIPVQASPLDILAQEAVSKIITRLGKSSVTLMVLNKIDRRSKITDEAMELIVPKFPNKPVWISQRVSFPRGGIAGMSAGEIDNAARREIKNLWTGIAKILRKTANVKVKHSGSRKAYNRKADRPAQGREFCTERGKDGRA